MLPWQAKLMVNLNPNVYLPSHKQGIVSKCVWGFLGRKRWYPLFGLRKELSRAAQSPALAKIRSPLELVTQSASAAWDLSLGKYVLYAPTVTIVQAWGQCAGNMPAFQHKVEGFFPATKFLQANASLMDKPQLVGSVNTGLRTAHCVLSAVFEVQKNNNETFVHLFIPLTSNKTVSNSFPADEAHRKQQGLCPPFWGEGKKESTLKATGCCKHSWSAH